MTASPLVRLASIMDPAFRYAEHRRSEAFYDDEVFYYQGTRFIADVEQPARSRAQRVPRLRRDRDPRRLRPDGQHGRLQRPRRVCEPRRPQGRAAAHRHGDEQPHRQGRASERPAHGRPARLRGSRPAHRRPGGRQLRDARGQPVSHRRGRERGAHRPLPARAHRLRPQHGAASRAGRRDQQVPRRAGHRRRRPVRHGPRARPARAALPGALRRRRRPGDRLDPQDLLRHPARRRRQPLRRDRRALRALGGAAPARVPGVCLEPPPGHAARVAVRDLRDARLPRRIPAAGDGQRQGLRPGAARRRPRRAGRSGDRLHRDPPGDRAGRLRSRPRDGDAPRGQQHPLQLPGPARRGGLHRRRRPAPGCLRDDALRHARARLRGARRAYGRRHQARRGGGRAGHARCARASSICSSASARDELGAELDGLMAFLR